VRGVVPGEGVKIEESCFVFSVDLDFKSGQIHDLEEASVVVSICAVYSSKSSICIDLKVKS